MNLEFSLKKLYSLHQFGIKLGLESTLKILGQVGNPHEKLKCYHVAGSNGKGSTASFLTSILMEHGYKVGLYTSPHFVKFNERIRVDGKEINDEYICEFISSMEDYIDDNHPTFFEITTALAFKYFVDSKVDYAVIETGLGGRLDSTNVIDPIASIISSISLEHTEILGDTIEKIAYEKGGIVKRQTPVFVGPVPPEAEETLRAIAAKSGSEIIFAQDFISMSSDHITVHLHDSHFSLYTTPLIGYHQLLNAGLAIKTLCSTLKQHHSPAIFRGIEKVVNNTSIQGRYEVFSNNPRIIFDSAHNPESIRVFLNQFELEYNRYNTRELIFGAMKDKDINSMLKLLNPYFQRIFISIPTIDRAASFQTISNIAELLGLKVTELTEPADYIRKFKEERRDDCLVALGSMYLLGEIKLKIL